MFYARAWPCHLLDEDLPYLDYHSPFRRNRMDLANPFCFSYRLILFHLAWFVMEFALFYLFKEFDVREYYSKNVSSLKGECNTPSYRWQTYPCLFTFLVYNNLRMVITLRYWWYILKLSTFPIHKIGIPSKYWSLYLLFSLISST